MFKQAAKEDYSEWLPAHTRIKVKQKGEDAVVVTEPEVRRES